MEPGKVESAVFFIPSSALLSSLTVVRTLMMLDTVDNVRETCHGILELLIVGLERRCIAESTHALGFGIFGANVTMPKSCKLRTTFRRTDIEVWEALVPKKEMCMAAATALELNSHPIVLHVELGHQNQAQEGIEPWLKVRRCNVGMAAEILGGNLRTLLARRLLPCLVIGH